MENRIIGNGRYKIIKELNRGACRRGSHHLPPSLSRTTLLPTPSPGGTAVVYSGIDLITSKTVALKVMSAKHKKESNLKAVKREIEYAMSVRCEYVVQLLDFVSDDQHVVIVWELIEGSDLLDLLNEKGGRLNERDAAFYFSQLHQAISFIHSNGLVHRDLKPENCMVEAATNKIKLIDFGLSKRDQSAVTLGVGTPDYMSPELLGMDAGDDFVALKQRREGKYDAKACDVWALGVLLYLLVTGKYAFEDPRKANNVIATLQNIRSGKMRALPSRISPECSDLIQKMLQHDPTKRITLVRTFLLLLTTARSSIQSRYRSAPAQALTRSFARSPGRHGFASLVQDVQRGRQQRGRPLPVPPVVVLLPAVAADSGEQADAQDHRGRGMSRRQGNDAAWTAQDHEERVGRHHHQGDQGLPGGRRRRDRRKGVQGLVLQAPLLLAGTGLTDYKYV